MADVSYISPGASATAAKWNELFAALDAKLDAALAGRNALMWNNSDHAGILMDNSVRMPSGELGGVVGWVYCFVGASRRITGTIKHHGLTRPNYDHSIFEALIAGATVSTYDATHQFVRIPVPTATYALVGLDYNTNGGDDFFAASLEAHQMTYTPPAGSPASYWVMQTDPSATPNACAYPCKQFRYSQAEIAVEDYGSTLTMLAKYNRHNFFRVHNCQGIDLSVEFKGTDGSTKHTLTVPAWGSKCVRRTSVDGTYTEGYKYLQKMKAGDPRFLNFGETLDPVGSGLDILHESYRSALCNSATNPFVVYKWVKLFVERGQSANQYDRGGSFFRDPLTQWDASSLYADQYGTITDTTPLARLRHHAGELLHITQDPATPSVVTAQTIDFQGWETAVADFAAGGITLEKLTYNEGGGLSQITGYSLAGPSDGKNHWLLPVSCNILGGIQVSSDASLFIYSATSVAPNRAVSLASKLYMAFPVTFGASGLFIGVSSIKSREVYAAGSGTSYGLSYSGGSATRYEESAAWTSQASDGGLSEGSATVIQAQSFVWGQFGEWGERTRGELMLTGFGPKLLGEYTITELPAQTSGFGYRLEFGNYVPSGATSALIRFESGAIKLTEEIDLLTSYHWPTAGNPWFLNARNTRRYADLESGGSTSGAVAPIADAGFPAWPIYGADPHLVHPSQTEELQADGSDFRVEALSDTESTLAIQAPCNPPTAPVSNYGKVPFLPLPDVLYGALTNYATSGWWNTHAARVVAGTANKTADGGVTYGGTDYWYRHVRFVLSVEYFNNLAALVNSVKWVRSLDFWQFYLDIGGGTMHRLLANTDGLYNSCRPRTQYSKLSSQDEDFCAVAGIWPRDYHDLPGLGAVIGADKKFLRLALATSGHVVTSRSAQNLVYSGWYNDRYDNYVLTPSLAFDIYSSGTFSEADARAAFGRFQSTSALSDNTTHSWCEISEVEAFAESVGYPFRFEQAGVPFRVAVLEYENVAPGDAAVTSTQTMQIGGAGVGSGFAVEMVDPFVPEVDGATHPDPLWAVSDSISLSAVTWTGRDTVAWNFLACIVDEDGDWVTSDFSFYRLGDDEPGDDVKPLRLTLTGTATAAYSAFSPAYSDYERHQFDGTFYTPAEYYNVADLKVSFDAYFRLAISTEWERRYLLRRNDLVSNNEGFSAGVGQYFGSVVLTQNWNSPASALVEIPVSFFQFTSHNYSSVSDANLQNAANTGVTRYPLQATSPTSPALASISLGSGEEAHAAEADKCYRLLHYVAGVTAV